MITFLNIFRNYSPLLAHLCELLIVSLVFNELDLAAVIIQTEAGIPNRKSRYYKVSALKWLLQLFFSIKRYGLHIEGYLNM